MKNGEEVAPSWGGFLVKVPWEAHLKYEDEIPSMVLPNGIKVAKRFVFSARGFFGLRRFYQVPDSITGAAQEMLSDLLREHYRTPYGRWKAAVMDVRRWLKPRLYYWLRGRKYDGA